MAKRTNPVLRLGTRASQLALYQSNRVAKWLERVHKDIGLKVELIEISTLGDQDRKSALKSFGGTGVFVKELELALLHDEIDLAVHSLKDLPIKQPPELKLVAVPEREDVRDVLLTKSGKPLKDLPQKAIIGSGSPRRRAQLKLKFPHLRFKEIRGNVDTRIKKVLRGDYDATILARAGMKRLSFLKEYKEHIKVLPLSIMLPAASQGALGIECRKADRLTNRLLKVIHNTEVFNCIEAERACLGGLGGGCHLPLGVYCKIDKAGDLQLDAVLALPDGTLQARTSLKGSIDKPRQLGRQAASNLKKSPNGKELIRLIG